MSIRISEKKCVGCGNCVEVCPGNLICMGEDKKAFIKYPRDCWGCAACVKECCANAIRYYLGADIGGKGTFLYTKVKGDCIDFIFVKEDKEEVIKVSRREANKY